MTLSVNSRALSLAAVVLLAGCGDTQNAASPPAQVAPVSHGNAHQTPKSSGDLLYVPIGERLNIYSYPGYQKVDTVKSTWLGFNAAADPNNGNVCFDNYGQVIEYAHGATQPFARFQAPLEYESYDCAYDPTTDNLAETLNGTNGGYVAIYTSPSGNPTTYSDPGMKYYEWLAYDAGGDLFVDGQNSLGGDVLIDELPKGGTSFIELTLNQQIAPVGTLQWDGTYMTVGSGESIFQLSVSGSSATIVGKTTIKGWKNHKLNGHYTITGGDTVVGAYPERTPVKNGQYFSHVGLWHYPAGGRAYKVIKFVRPSRKDNTGAAVVSVAPPR